MKLPPGESAKREAIEYRVGVVVLAILAVVLVRVLIVLYVLFIRPHT